jgi:two-component system chemotaxis response regulator CheY
MRILIVEDDFTSRRMLSLFLAPYGQAEIAVDGEEAVTAFRTALSEKQPYDLICLDVMMPRLDGQAALRQIRGLEEQDGVMLGFGAKIIMVTALSDHQTVMTAFREQADAYLVKPIDRHKLLEVLKRLQLVQ